MNKKPKLSPKILVSLFCLAVILLIVFFPKQNTIDQLPDEPSSNKYSSQVIFTNGEELLKQTENLEAHEALASDLFLFAKKIYPAYQKNGVSIGFKLKENPVKTDSTIKFEGRFGAVKNSIRVEVTLLKNKKIKLSVTDTKTNKNIDSELPSNSAANQFIGTLPIEKATYKIDYIAATENFLITSYDGNPSTKQAAEQLLMTSLKLTSLEKVSYEYYVVRSAGTQNFPNLD